MNPALQDNGAPVSGVAKRIAMRSRYIYLTIGLTVGAGTDILNRMVKQSSLRLDTLFRALGDATRRQMLQELARHPRTVSQLAEPHRMSLAAASKHIRTLERAGLVRRTVTGRTHVCELEPSPLEGVKEWLRFYDRFWTARLDALELELRGSTPKPRRKR